MVADQGLATPSDVAATVLERESEAAALDQLLERAVGGAGAVVAVEGPAGIGKTTLLGLAARHARQRGLEVLAARGAPLEGDFPFGVVRQLFEPVLAAAGDERRDALLVGAAALALRALDERGLLETGGEDVSYATLHGLYWLCANLAAERPLLLAVDDAQWADPPSLRFLLHLLQRLDGLPVVVVVAWRSGEPAAAEDLLASVLSEAARPLRLRPLGPQASATLVREHLSAETTDAFCAACHAATNGNPFLLHELVVELRARGMDPVDAHAGRVQEFTPEAVARSLERRLARLPAGARALAEAATILGESAELRHAVALAGLSDEQAAVGADALAAAEIVASTQPLRFVHPLLRAAVQEAIPPAERALRHARAARLLRAAGASPERVAVQFLFAEPAGDPEVVAALREAAGVARSRGALDLAERYLRRALAEPPEARERAAVLHELGMAGASGSQAEAVPILFDAVAQTHHPRKRAERALEAARVLGISGFTADAVAICQQALEDAGGLDPKLALRVEAELVISAMATGACSQVALETLARYHYLDQPTSAGEALMVLNRGVSLVRQARPADEAAEVIERTLMTGLVAGHEDSMVLAAALLALVWTDRLELAGGICDAVVAESRRRGLLTSVSAALFLRALVAHRRGAVDQAASDAAASLAIAGDPSRKWSLAPLLDALVERGDLEAAEEALVGARGERCHDDDLGGALLTESRGRLRAAQGRLREGLNDLLDAGRRWRSLGVAGPSITTWRLDAALVHARLGQRDDARRLAAEELKLARGFGTARAVGAALRVAGVVEGGAGGVELLREAVRTLEGSPASLMLVHALVDLGALLRSEGRRMEARHPLRRALDDARGLGAGALRARARAELAATGARPRREALWGADALTPSERRVAELAAAGRSNPEIAQELFVTRKTVEFHLRGAYRKLGIGSRGQLGAALAA